jgi:SAM-dependent methyltransferase
MDETNTEHPERIVASEVNYLDHYMDEFYSSLTAENEEIGTFLYESGHSGRLLDVACGPSALYWAMFHPNVTEIHGIDAREDSIMYLRNIIDAAARGSIGDQYAEIARWHGASEVDASAKAASFAERFTTAQTHDIRLSWPYEAGQFEGVVSCFGVDHVETREEFLQVLKEAHRVLVQGGRLTLATLCETSSWICGGNLCACLYTTRESLAQDLSSVGFQVEFLEERSATTALEQGQGYEKMLFCRAVKL